MEIPHQIGRYEVLARVGEGGEATVFKGRDPAMKRFVAIKLLRGKSPLKIPSAEAERLARLSHGSIARVFDVGSHEGQDYIVSQFIGGPTLREWLATASPSPGQASAIVRLIAKALQHAHDQGIVHCDVKPANVILRGHQDPVLVDFGIGRVKGEELDTEDYVVGSFPYLSPEHVKGGIIDERTDVYGLGLLLFEMLAGQPVRTESRTCEIEAVLDSMHDDLPMLPKGVRYSVPKALQRVCLRCLQPEQARRYQSCTALISDLEATHRRIPAVIRRIALGGTLLLLLFLLIASQVYKLASTRSVQSAPQSSPGTQSDATSSAKIDIPSRPVLLESSAIGSVAHDASDRVDSAASDKRLNQEQAVNSFKPVKVIPAVGRRLALTRDGRILATYGRNKFQFWDVSTGEQHVPFAIRRRDQFHILEFSRTGDWLTAYWSRDEPGERGVTIWDMPEGRVSQTIKPRGEAVSCLSYSADRDLLVVSHSDGADVFEGRAERVSVYDTASGKEARILYFENSVDDLEFSPDSSLLVVASYRDGVDVWDTDSWQLEKSLDAARHVCFTREGDKLFTTGESIRDPRWESLSEVHIWNADDWSQDGLEVVSPVGEPEWIHVDVARDLLILAGYEQITFSSLKSGQHLHTVDGESLSEPAVSGDGRILTVGVRKHKHPPHLEEIRFIDLDAVSWLEER